MTKASGAYEGLSRGQMRVIARSTKTTRQLAIKYGVREATIAAIIQHFRDPAVKARRDAIVGGAKQ